MGAANRSTNYCRMLITQVVALVFCFGISDAAAQRPEAGQRIRVTFQDPGETLLIGTFEQMFTDSFTIRTEGVVQSVSLNRIALLEISQGKRNHAGVGLAVGAVLGALAGFVGSSGIECGGQDEGGWCVMGPLLAAGGFGLVGLGVGAAIRGERWLEVRFAPTGAVSR